MSPHVRQVLDTLIGEALCDREIRAALLNGHRADVIMPLGLSQEEKDFVLGISARTLHEFARKLHGWLADEDHEEPLSAGLCACGFCFASEELTGRNYGRRNG